MKVKKLHTLAQCNVWTATVSVQMSLGKSTEDAIAEADRVASAMRRRIPVAPPKALAAVNDAMSDLRAALAELRERMSKLERRPAVLDVEGGES